MVGIWKQSNYIITVHYLITKIHDTFYKGDWLNFTITYRKCDPKVKLSIFLS